VTIDVPSSDVVGEEKELNVKQDDVYIL